VGVSLDANFNLRAYLLENGRMTVLNELISPDSRWDLMLASFINSRGEIVGLALNKNNVEFPPFLASPKN
jgi:hypothetical protein